MIANKEGKIFRKRVEGLLRRISLSCLDKEFNILLEYDKKYTQETLSPIYKSVKYEEPVGRLYIQLSYSAQCTKTKKVDSWKGRKWYLTQHMTDDEIVKTCYAAFEACIKHEILEGFKVDGKILFNPHVNFEKLLKITKHEIKRKNR